MHLIELFYRIINGRRTITSLINFQRKRRGLLTTSSISERFYVVISLIFARKILETLAKLELLTEKGIFPQLIV